MFSLADLKRKLKNLIRITTIITPNPDGKALATVRVGADKESIEFPVLSFANTFKKHWIPIRENEQVLVLFPFGNGNKGYIFRGVFFRGLREPVGADKDTEIIEYEDGTRLSYSVKDSTLKVSGNCKIVIEAENVEVTTKQATVKANSVLVDSASIDLGKGGTGVVTQGCVCAFTGNPHPQGSMSVRSTN